MNQNLSSLQLLEQLEKTLNQTVKNKEFKSALAHLKLSLEKDENQLHCLLENIDEGFANCEIICDSDGQPIDYRILKVNTAYEKQTGLTTDTILGKRLLEVFPNSDRSSINFYGQVALNQKPQSKRVYCQNTNRHYAARVCSSAQGEFTMLVEDITKSVALDAANEEILKNQEERSLILANIDENVVHCELIFNEQGKPYDVKVLEVNRKQQNADCNVLTDDNQLELLAHSKPYLLDAILEVGLSQIPQSFTDYCDSTNTYYDLNIYSLKKGFVIVIYKDVTALEEQKLKVEESEALKRDTIKNMLDGYIHSEIICDAQNKPIDYKILDVNPSFEEQSGIKAEDIIGKTMLEFFPDAEESWIEIVGQVGMSGKPHTITQYSCNNDKIFEINAFSPKPNHVVKIFRDITKREKECQELELAYKKAEENEKLTAAFLANISHEVRTPMNAILGFSSLLEDSTVSEVDKKTALSQIKSSGNRLLHIITDIVDLSRIDSNQHKLALEKFDLNKIFDELLHQYSVLNKNINLSISIHKGHKDGPYMLVSDEEKLIQILANLIENAMKFTQSGELVFGYTLEEGFVKFYVKDTGIGIEKDDFELVFKRFGQIENKTREVTSGTGLGLAIAKGLVAVLEGDIWFESTPRKGSTFYFSIPISSTVKPVVNKQHKFTILIAEDDDVNFLLLDLWLNCSFNVIRAANGYEAVSLFQKNDAIDIILMDIRMPYLNGVEATKEIRAMNPKIPIIAHTAYGMSEEYIQIKKAGCSQVLIKPITRDTLLMVLAKYNIVI